MTDLSQSLPELATPQEVAALLHKTPENVWLLLRKGDLPGKKIAGRWYVNLSALRDLLQAS